MVINNEENFVILKELEVPEIGQVSYNKNEKPEPTEECEWQASGICMSAVSRCELMGWIWDPTVGLAYYRMTKTSCGPCTQGEQLNGELLQPPT